MIWESWPWKEALLEDAEKLKNLVFCDENEKGWVEFERLFLISAYCMRKLFEAKKLTTALEQASIQVKHIPIKDKDKKPDLLNWHDLDRFYDINASETKVVPIRSLVNSIIHSFVFIPIFSNDTGQIPVGVFIASDHSKSKGIMEVSLAEYIKLMQRVGHNEVTEARFARDSKTGDWIVKNT